jgi:uncharacterized protein (TIGR03083 family)
MEADNSRDGLIEQLHDAWDALASLGRQLDDAQWSAPTPCPGWSVAAQYAHVIGTESMLLGRDNPDAEVGEPEHVRNPIGNFNEVWVVALAERPRPEVLDLFDEVISARRKALDAMTDADFDAESWTPVGKSDYRRFMQIRVFDCWVHEQDVRDAINLPGHANGPAATQAIDEIVRAAGYVVGKKAGVPSGSSVRFELTGPITRRIDVDVTDRAKVVEGLSGTPSATLSMTSTAFARLSCGRIAPERVLDGAFGGVSFSGDADLGRQVLANLAFTV